MIDLCSHTALKSSLLKMDFLLLKNVNTHHRVLVNLVVVMDKDWRFWMNISLALDLMV